MKDIKKKFKEIEKLSMQTKAEINKKMLRFFYYGIIVGILISIASFMIYCLVF